MNERESETVAFLAPLFQELLIQLTANKPENAIHYSVEYFRQICRKETDVYKEVFVECLYSFRKCLNFRYVNLGFGEVEVMVEILSIITLFFHFLDLASNQERIIRSEVFKTLLNDFLCKDFQENDFPDNIKAAILKSVSLEAEELVSFELFYKGVEWCVKCSEFLAWIRTSLLSLAGAIGSQNRILRADFDLFFLKLLKSVGTPVSSVADAFDLLEINSKNPVSFVSLDICIWVVFNWVHFKTIKTTHSKPSFSSNTDLISNQLNLSEMLGSITKSK